LVDTLITKSSSASGIDCYLTGQGDDEKFIV